MSLERDGAVVRHLGTLFNVGTFTGLDDRQLLERFATSHPEAAEGAFAALMERHGPMVLRVCRGVLADPHDADDAFQATFLVLVRKARTLWVRDSLGPWLHRVAYQTSCCARSDVVRRRRHEYRAAEVRAANRVDERAGTLEDEWEPVLHEEIHRLPERYRVAVVLCSLEGLTQEEAAQRLGWPVGTVKSRLARARERLKERLTRRGRDLAPWAGNCRACPRLAVPTALLDSTIQAVMPHGVVSARVIALTERGLRMMLWTKWRFTVVAALTAGVVAAGAGLLSQRHAGAQQRDAPAAAGPEEDDVARRRESDKNLKHISLALHNYHSANNHFPPPAITDPTGKPLLSWRVAILPFLIVGDAPGGIQGRDLYSQFRLDEPWDSPHNKPLLAKMPKRYAHPGGTKDPSTTFYRAFVGHGAAFEEGQGTDINGFTDGTSNTLMVAEAGEPVPWTKPDELPYVPGAPIAKLGGLFPDVFAASFADGSVRFIRNEIDRDSLRALITRNGGERIVAGQVAQWHLPARPAPTTVPVKSAQGPFGSGKAILRLDGLLNKESKPQLSITVIVSGKAHTRLIVEPLPNGEFSIWRGRDDAGKVTARSISVPLNEVDNGGGKE